MYAAIIILLPILGGLLCLLWGSNATIRNSLSFGVTIVLALLALGLYPLIQRVNILVFEYPLLIPPFGLSFRLDWLSLALVIITTVVWLLVTYYSVDYMKHYENQARYFGFSLITLGATLGTLVAGDLLTLFLFFELMSLTSYVLVIHDGTKDAMKAGYQYLIMTLGGGLALLFGIMGIYHLAGTVSFMETGFINQSSPIALGSFLAFLAGFGMKAGMFPLHVWLPKAHPVAPSPASAILSGIMLKVGAYGLLRVLYNIYDVEFLVSVGWNNILMVIAGITLIVGSVFAIMQSDLKRRLAYSSVGQMGYILMGMSFVSEQALIGDVFHIFAHATMKACLFLAAGAIIMQTGKRDIRELSGIGRRMPITMICFTMAALAVIGIPPFSGFLSKWYLGLGALETGHPWYASLLLVSSLLNAIYYLPIVISAFFGTVSLEFVNIREVSHRMLIPIVILALSTVLFDLIPLNVPLILSTIVAKFLYGGGIGIS